MTTRSLPRSPVAAPSIATVLLWGLLIGCQTEPVPPPAVEQTASDAAKTLLIRGATVLTMDAASTVIENGAVAIEGQTIAAVGSSQELAERFPDARVIDAAGRIVMPGLINTHTHVPMTLFRGLADDLELMEWLETVIFPAEAEHVDEDFVRWGTRLACLEMVRGGTTTFVDMYYFEDAIAEEAVRCGLRTVAGETLIDFPAPDNKTWDEAVAYTERYLEKWADHPLVTPAVAPHALYTVSAEHLQVAHALAAKYDAPLLIHLSEHQSEIETSRQLSGKLPIDYLDDLGILDDSVLAAHVIWPSEAEIQTLVDRQVGVAHCPQSNMKIAAGVAPVPQMLEAGLAVGLGTDGTASNNDLNLWEEIDTAAKLHKVTTMDATVVNARQAVAMATIEGARALHMDDEIGSLEVGKRADVIVVDVSGPRHQPFYDAYSALAYTVKASDVETVIVNGQILLEKGQYTLVDPAPILKKATEYRDRILASRESAAP